jgi:hypothetical protein
VVNPLKVTLEALVGAGFHVDFSLNAPLNFLRDKHEKALTICVDVDATVVVSECTSLGTHWLEVNVVMMVVVLATDETFGEKVKEPRTSEHRTDPEPITCVVSFETAAGPVAPAE